MRKGFIMTDKPKKINPATMVLTGKDNVTHDVVRWGGAAAIVASLVYEGFVVFSNGVFDIQNFGLGMCTLLVGIGGALKVKESTEPSE